MIFLLSEYTKRYKIFVDNMKKIQRLNENERGTASYGPTKFSDLTGIDTISFVWTEGPELYFKGPAKTKANANKNLNIYQNMGH